MTFKYNINVTVDTKDENRIYRNVLSLRNNYSSFEKRDFVVLSFLLVKPNRTTSLERINVWLEWVFQLHLTCKPTKSELKKFIDEPVQVPQWSCHTQSNREWCIKQVTDAADECRPTHGTHETRDGYIRDQEASQQLMPKTWWNLFKHLVTTLIITFWCWFMITWITLCLVK